MSTLTKVDIPEGESGDWKVERFSVSEDEARFFNLRASIKGNGHRMIQVGEYTKLTHRGHIVMSDTPAEMRDHWQPVNKAKGKVLINGLGLGMVAEACLRKTDVEHVTVTEISEDVIKLVAPTLKEQYGDRLTIIHADALTWQPPKGKKYDVVWHDIWPDICTDNKKTMAKLHRKYAQRTQWQGSWARYEVERAARLGR
jgi:hypothetical protein